MSRKATKNGLARYVTAELKRLADPAKAPMMVAYMKTTLPFFGVSTPRCSELLEQMGRPVHSCRSEIIRAERDGLWKLRHREER